MVQRTSISAIKKWENLTPYIAVLPVILCILIFRAYPIGEVFFKSFTNWDGLFKSDWIGLSNYKHLFESEYFWQVMQNCLILLLNVPIQIFIGIAVAMLLYEKVLGWRFFRSLFYLPQIISAVIVGYLFKIFFSYDGPVNLILKTISHNTFTIDWLGERATAMIVIISALVWINIGWQGVIFLGGLSSISPTVFDAAELDGANFWQRTFHIVLPMLVRVIEYSCIISISWTFSGLFPFIYSITKGGPGYDTSTLDYLIYQKAFAENSGLGQACAIAMVLLIIITVITVIQKIFADKADDWGD